jgi:hypothetical protein
VLAAGVHTDGKREREAEAERFAPPCHHEFRYEDGETVNEDPYDRVMGGSAKFTRMVEDALPLGTSLTTSEQIRALSHFTQTSWDTVLRELYSDRAVPLTTPSNEQLEDEAFVTRHDNHAKPQFYLKTTGQSTTLSHIQPDGAFWGRGMRDSRSDPTIDDMCYTNGFIWTNPNPQWAWRSANSVRVIRVRVDIPAGTQVVMDRAPVYGGRECQFDEHRVSRFPDVLLGPAEFRVTDVMRYRSTNEDYSRSGESPELFEYVEPRKCGPSESDLEYAQLRVFDADEFMDVRMVLVRQIKLPQVGSIRFPGPSRTGGEPSM